MLSIKFDFIDRHFSKQTPLKTKQNTGSNDNIREQGITLLEY